MYYKSGINRIICRLIFIVKIVIPDVYLFVYLTAGWSLLVDLMQNKRNQIPIDYLFASIISICIYLLCLFVFIHQIEFSNTFITLYNDLIKIHYSTILHVKFFSYRNNSHTYNWIFFTYFITARYKSIKYIMNRYDTVPTNIIKIAGPYFDITTLSIIIDLKVESRLIV